MRVLFLTTYFQPLNVDDPNYQKESTFKLWSYFKDQGVDAHLARYADLRFEFGQKTDISLRGESLESFDLIFPRSATQLHEYGIDHTSLCQAVAFFAQKKNIPMVNIENLTQFPPTFSKLFQMNLYGLNSIPIPQSYFSASGENIAQFPFPLVKKPFTGSHGNNIGVVPHSEQVSAAETTEVLFQEILPNRQDYRILVMNKQPIGAILRKAAEDKFVANFSAGGSVEAIEVDDEMNQLSVQLANLLKLDFCGVDLMRDGSGKLRVLEVNRFPEFNGFELATKMNVREKLLTFVKSL